MESIEIITILAGILIFASVSHRIHQTFITLPMLYTLFGVLVGVIFKNWMDLSYENPLVETITNLTFVMVLATDASRMRLKNTLRFHNLPLRLLLIALPLTIVFGTIFGAILFKDVSFWIIAILAVALTPTDDSLAERSVDNPSVPLRIRQALTIEGALGDGILMPFLILTVSIAISSEIGLGSGALVFYTLQHIIVGALVGIAIGYLGARYIEWGKVSRWMSPQFQKIGWLAMIVLTYGIADQIGGNGYIAAFLFGLVFGNRVDQQENDAIYEYAEVGNSLFVLVTYIIFGMVLLTPALQQINLTILVYAVLSLTLVRMLPVLISMIGTKLKPVSVLYIGWFGPRGIGSILYVFLILGVDQVAENDLIFTVVMTTIFLSVMLHGISASPLSKRYSAYLTRLKDQGIAAEETISVPEMRERALKVVEHSLISE
jgi:NhaP-type Na+/H+ or K+/H+ antiporter